MQTKPGTVFCRGIWADRSGFSKVIPQLRAEGHEVTAAQYGLASNDDDVEAGFYEGIRVRNQSGPSGS